jgi:hypothetical protein
VELLLEVLQVLLELELVQVGIGEASSVGNGPAQYVLTLLYSTTTQQTRHTHCSILQVSKINSMAFFF